jgi:hypothetical protein
MEYIAKYVSQFSVEILSMWELECINTPHTTRPLVQQLKTELFLRVVFYFVIPLGRLSFTII